MGQIIGLLARKNGELCFNEPIFTREDDTLISIFMEAKEYVSEFINERDLNERLKGSLTLNEQELESLMLNWVLENSDIEDKINYHLSISQPVPENFKAICLIDDEEGKMIYDDKFEEFENWHRTKIIKSAVFKLSKILHIKLDNDIINKSGGRGYILYDFENLLILEGILKTIEKIYSPDEFALVWSSY